MTPLRILNLKMEEKRHEVKSHYIFKLLLTGYNYNSFQPYNPVFRVRRLIL
jgi:hypothetical protein